jgi:hypothetical protein
VEGLSTDHDQVFMSFNIEHWYPLLGANKTAETTFLPITKPVALALSSLHEAIKTRGLTKQDVPSLLDNDAILTRTAKDLDLLIPVEGAFIKTSARSCKDIALQIGLKNIYQQNLVSAIDSSGGKEFEEMTLRSIFMEAARDVLRFIEGKDFLVACALSNRVSGVLSFIYQEINWLGH